MNHYCCVPYCCSWAKKNPEISFHTFPTAGKYRVIVETKLGNKELVDRRQVWIKNLRIGKKVSPYMRVCSLHFTSGDYFHEDRIKRRVLKLNAVPTQNLPLESKTIPKTSGRQERANKKHQQEKTPKPSCSGECEDDDNIDDSDISAAKGLLLLMHVGHTSDEATPCSSHDAAVHGRAPDKTLKESLLAEQERLLMQVTEEKLQLASEKAKFETSTKLVNSYEVERAKTEAETAISEAKKLTERLNQERNLLQRQKSEMARLKQNLSERERELEDKEAELEFLMQDAHKKLKEDKQVLVEAKRMETTYKEKLRELQSQWALLSNREKKLAEEKILLSRERLALYTSIKASKDCVLCGTGEDTPFGQNAAINSTENVKIPSSSAFKIRLDAMDDEESEIPSSSAVKIRLDAMDDEESEVCREGSVHNK